MTILCRVLRRGLLAILAFPLIRLQVDEQSAIPPGARKWRSEWDMKEETVLHKMKGRRGGVHTENLDFLESFSSPTLRVPDSRRAFSSLATASAGDGDSGIGGAPECRKA